MKRSEGYVNSACFGVLIVIGTLLQSGCTTRSESTEVLDEFQFPQVEIRQVSGGYLGDLSGYVVHLTTLSEGGNPAARVGLQQMLAGEGMPMMESLALPDGTAGGVVWDDDVAEDGRGQ